MRKKIGLGYIAVIKDPLTRRIFFERCYKGKSWAAVAVAVGGGNTPESCRKIFERYIKENEKK